MLKCCYGAGDESAKDNGDALCTFHNVIYKPDFIPGAGYLQNRSWQGLEQKLGQTEVKKATEGERGIAMSYDKEKG